MTGDPWIRNARVEGVTDGDSIVCMVDLGYRVWHRTKVRLLGIDAPERGEVGWSEARAHLGLLAPPLAAVTVTTVGPDKYGDRWDGWVTLADGTDLSQAQIDGGFAVPYDGGAR